ncbi:unnamed protein product [Ilex paraguariensis]|uniref:C2 NT-type domain-containing protein n=1 Tax=Ilex paraguariensis TaxID=185542 RepID=A0ABC8SRB8_9AQUA
MFKSARWRSEKNKIKAVFILRFQATQVPQLRRKTLNISLVPADIGKPTVRLEKAPILEGTCTWEHPIYETVKLIRDTKTGRFKQKIYHFIVSTGSSKSGFLGEVSLDFADYAEEIKPLIVSLPLEASNSSAILHISPYGEFCRDVEEDEAPRAESQDISLGNLLGNCIEYGDSNLDFTEDRHFNNMTSQGTEQSSSFNNTRLDNTPNPLDFTTLRWKPMPEKGTVDVIPAEKQKQQRSKSNTNPPLISASNGSMVDSTTSLEENFIRDWSSEASNNATEKLKNEISMLERQAEVSELELQSLRKQMVKENKRGLDLSRQVASLKVERDVLKREFEELKSSLKRSDEAEVKKQSQSKAENIRVLLEQTVQELNHEKDLNNTLRLQLHKTEDSHSELIFAVRDLEGMLEEKGREMSHLTSKTKARQNAKEAHAEASKSRINWDEDEKAMGELIKENDNDEEADSLKKKITALNGEIFVHRKDNEELKTHMELLALEYDILKKENQDISSKLKQKQIEQMKMQTEYSESIATIKELQIQIDRLEKKINKQALEFSESLDTINELETQVKSSQKQLENQTQSFQDDLHALTQAKVEQEQRAIQAEEALRKTRWHNANAAERLQEELRRLSVEMASKIDANENLAMKAKDLSLQNGVMEEMVQKANEELRLMKDQCKEKLQELLNQTNLQATQLEQMSLELEDSRKQVETYKRREQEKHDAFSTEMKNTQRGDKKAQIGEKGLPRRRRAERNNES